MTDLSPSSYAPQRSLPAKITRRLTQLRAASPMSRSPSRAIVSFTFDDFPKSAVDTGADILDGANAKGCYYACTGLAKKVNATGTLFDENDLNNLHAAGHEIGAHTHNHLDCSQNPVTTVLDDIQRNLNTLKEMGHTAPITQFAYPYGETKYTLKKALIPLFPSVRGILPGVNGRGSDLMQLRAMELTPDSSTTDRAAAAIEAAANDPKWIIIFTHDVSEKPSPFGTTPAALRQLVTLAKDSGAEILTPTAALAKLERAS